MSFSTVAAQFFNLPRLFLKICWWVLLRMALNCRLPSFGDIFRTNLRAKEAFWGFSVCWRWRRILLLVWILCSMFLSKWVYHDLRETTLLQMQVNNIELWQDRIMVLQEHFNISSDQIQCLGSLLSKADQKSFLDCVVKSVVQKQHGGVDHPSKDQCPVLEDKKYKPSSVDDSRDTISCHILSNEKLEEEECLKILRLDELKNCVQPLGRISFVLLNMGWWVFVWFVVNCKLSGFLGREMVKASLQQPKQPQAYLKLGGRWRETLLVLWVLAGLVLSIRIFQRMNGNITLRRKDMLASMCDERARMLQDQFNVSMNHVNALAILVSTFHHGKHPSAIDQKTFAEYTERTSFERPLTSGVAYALKVLHSDREQFETQHGWTIKKMEQEDQSLVQDDYIPERLDISPVQDEYAPVVFSQETVSHIVSVDMMSGKEDRENILRARATGKGALTSPFKLLKSNRLGVVLTFAVYNKDLPASATVEERIAATEGYLGASFDVPSLVEKLLHQLASKQTIVVNVYDTTNAFAPINMYGPIVTDTGMWHLSNLNFGDPFRKHEMHCRFKQKPSVPWSAITSALGVLVIIFLVGYIFHAAVSRITKVEEGCHEMRELMVRAKAADVAKSQFLATVSHEIRTPMTGVLGMLQMLLDTNLNSTQQDFARTAQASGKALIALINEVLDQAKIESGKLELEAVPFDLRAILDGILLHFSERSQEKGVELAVYISERVPEVLIGDPSRFRQIVTNLVGNSIKFTEQGHIFVSVNLVEEVKGLLKESSEFNKYENNNSLSGLPIVDKWKSWERFKKLQCVTNSADVPEKIYLLVTVEDTGVGIPLGAQGCIFMPFMQADSSTSRTYGGTGIGLSISKKLVEWMDGEIGCVSEPGIGSTFAFTAAFKKSEMISLDAKQQQSESMVTEFRGMRALVVDDRSTRAEVTKYHLQRLGIHVEIALTPESAFSCISIACNLSATNRLDVVLVDNEAWDKGRVLAFPHRLRELKQNGRPEPLQYLPKAFLLSSMNCHEYKSAGYLDVIMKPLVLSTIAASLQQALGVGNRHCHQSREQKSTLQSLLRDKRILVVDDNAVNRIVAMGTLKKYGALVTCADSGKDALAKLQLPHLFDACFMDLQMPDMDGFETTRRIRCIEMNINEQVKSGEASEEMYGNVSHWHVPILAMTADLIQATEKECVKCGMDGYVLKPFEEEQLYSAVACFFESDLAKVMWL